MMNHMEMMKVKKKAILFDMDGTLLDTFGEMKKENEAKKPSIFERYFNYRIGKLSSYSYAAVEEMVEKDAFLSPVRKQIMHALDKRMFLRYDKAMLKPGAEKFLTYLKEKGYIMCLCTNNARHIVDYILKEKELTPYFRYVITSHDVTKPKPDPEMYLSAMQKVAKTPAECIVFEDMLEGVEAACGAGVEVICVYDAFNQKDETAIHARSSMVIQNYEDERLYQLF